jgi:1-acyl-sn-glycerol-3-phosphate acyltransferase
MHLNDRTFDAAIAALQSGGAVQIYPEGQSHSEPSLTPLRTGAARIALMAESGRLGPWRTNSAGRPHVHEEAPLSRASDGVVWRTDRGGRIPGSL